MSRTKRIQRKRTKGWRAPKNSVIVDRTSKWGNPFKEMGDMIYCDASHRRKLFDPWVYYSGPFPENEINQRLRQLYALWISGHDFGNQVRPCTLTFQQIKKELIGKDLICFCDISEPCHADVLLVLAKMNQDLFVPEYSANATEV